MNYQETVNWMFNQLPMYQSQGKKAYKEDLTNIIKLSTYLGNPEHKFKSIHVGGTNGKGSTSHMIASVLQEAGYKVGLYTSPHLKSFTERVKINGKEIPEKIVTAFINSHKTFFEENQLSFFEMTVGLAFDFFAKEQVDIAIIEVGLGGRLDSTNIITPEVSVITNIGLDHVQILGDTLPKIAAEKAGIIKRNIPVVIGEKQEEVAEVFLKKSEELSSEIIFASEENIRNFETDLLGSYQKKNAKTAITAIAKVSSVSVSEENISKGLLNVVKNTGLKGRWQILQDSPKVICDTAHNKEGLTYVLNQLKEETCKQLHIVLGVVSDKNLKTILFLFPQKAIYYFCKPNIPRGLDEKELFKEAQLYNLKGRIFNSVNEAYNSALEKADKEDLVYVGGSTFVVSEVI
ncbi:bifunctional folylpolyglutamate synthase/dihydrofolate synthase [Tenacibaculum sp. M341]|uniref:bifunctional folylpolyglutamate synthase/dihydrofolate synthase n=1 Tax=Tenacibaculum sp. M341 TaxID=2530339 RepID=UPI001048047A|nr:folylpolyglutamate synthase/dihydrofolate synthase family protein [Tenacibaculum sp. M341]TCI91725.1 bifunctional folylpolyglutamate synthase/dihydrofolate synthase [Tenacibaculum sp. M341]